MRRVVNSVLARAWVQGMASQPLLDLDLTKNVQSRANSVRRNSGRHFFVDTLGLRQSGHTYMKKLLSLLGTGAMLAVASVPAHAFEFKAYDASTVEAAIASGKPVVVHVFAPWCLQCRAQETILGRLSTESSYEGVSFYRVDYDKQKDVVKALGTPRSTLIAFSGGAEVAKMSWGTSTQSVVGVLDAAR
jgi:thioredoxin 1